MKNNKTHLSALIGMVLMTSTSVKANDNPLPQEEFENWLEQQQTELMDERIEFVRKEILFQLTEEEKARYPDNIFNVNQDPKLTGPSAWDTEKFVSHLQKSDCEENCQVVSLKQDPLKQIDHLLELKIYTANQENVDINPYAILEKHRKRWQEIIAEGATTSQLLFQENDVDQQLESIVTQVLTTISDLNETQKVKLLTQLSGYQTYTPDHLSQTARKWYDEFDINRGGYRDDQPRGPILIGDDIPMVLAFMGYVMGRYEDAFGEAAAKTFYNENGSNGAKLLAATMELYDKFEAAYQVQFDPSSDLLVSLPTHLDFAQSIGIEVLDYRGKNTRKIFNLYRPTHITTDCEKDTSYVAGKTIRALSDTCVQPRFETDQSSLAGALSERRAEFFARKPEVPEWQKLLNFAFTVSEFAAIGSAFKGALRGAFVRPRFSSGLRLTRVRAIGAAPFRKLSRTKVNTVSKSKLPLRTYQANYRNLPANIKISKTVNGKQTMITKTTDGKVQVYQQTWRNRYVRFSDQKFDGHFIKKPNGSFERNGALSGGNRKNIKPQTEQNYKQKATRLEQADGGHSIARHGPDVSNKQLKQRIKKGQTPDRRFSPNDDATKFSSHKDWVQTRQVAFDRVQSRHGVNFGESYNQAPRVIPDQPYQVYVVHRHSIGKGFQGYGNRSLQRSTKKQGTNGRPKKDHLLEKTQYTDDIRVTKTTIGWDSTQGKWVVKQHYPSFNLPQNQTEYIFVEYL
ncbi:hypothetical protein [Algicola sagamiensis]|uniref:hypothetical protein n=1 Tax=Algicola sagamiensis TaxID=163869 RepID=UPI000361D512|nr:hypothetical protein [Algicola sagamiensis]